MKDCVDIAEVRNNGSTCINDSTRHSCKYTFAQATDTVQALDKCTCIAWPQV